MAQLLSTKLGNALQQDQSKALAALNQPRKGDAVQAANPWANLVGSEEFNPFTGALNRKQGEGLTAFRDRIAQQTTQAQAGQQALLDPTRQSASIKSVAEGITKNISGDQLAGQAAEDIDTQFAGQRQAQQLSQSRAGIDPSQNASRSGARMSRIAQASARAGAIQNARRAAESQNRSSFQSNLGIGANLVNQQTQFGMEQGRDSLQALQALGSQTEEGILGARRTLERNKLRSARGASIDRSLKNEKFNPGSGLSRQEFNNSQDSRRASNRGATNSIGRQSSATQLNLGGR
jgi:hypothetical protein